MHVHSSGALCGNSQASVTASNVWSLRGINPFGGIRRVCASKHVALSTDIGECLDVRTVPSHRKCTRPALTAKNFL